MQLIIRLLINAAALWVAAYFVPGIELAEDPLGIAIVAGLFGLVNALIRPVISILSLPFIFVTLGLFILVINAAMLGLTAWLAPALSVDGFFAAVIGSVIISIVSALLTRFVSDEKEEKNRR